MAARAHCACWVFCGSSFCYTSLLEKACPPDKVSPRHPATQPEGGRGQAIARSSRPGSIDPKWRASSPNPRPISSVQMLRLESPGRTSSSVAMMTRQKSDSHRRFGGCLINCLRLTRPQRRRQLSRARCLVKTNPLQLSEATSLHAAHVHSMVPLTVAQSMYIRGAGEIPDIPGGPTGTELPTPSRSFRCEISFPRSCCVALPQLLISSVDLRLLLIVADRLASWLRHSALYNRGGLRIFFS